MVFRFAIFQLLGCFFLLFSFQGSFFFSLPSVVSYLAGLLVYITISFSVCQHLFFFFYRLFLLSFLLSVLMLPLLPRWCVQFIISSSLCQFFSSLFLLSVQFSLYISNKWNYNQRNTVMLSFCSRVLHHKNFEFPILT